MAASKAKGNAMVWARRTFGATDWVAVQDHFETLFIAMGGPRRMMMVSSSYPGDQATDIYIQIPDWNLLSSFEGFEVVRESDLPPNPIPLIGNPDELGQLISQQPTNDR
jgi:hypothetical protein